MILRADRILFLVGQAISLVGAIFLVMSVLQKTKAKLLKFQLISTVASSMSTGLLHSFGASVSHMAAFARTVILQSSDADNNPRKARKLLTIFAAFALYMGVRSNDKGIIGILPPIASAGYTLAFIHCKSFKQIKIATLIMALLLAIHDWAMHFYIAFIGDTVSVIILIIQLCKGIEEKDAPQSWLANKKFSIFRADGSVAYVSSKSEMRAGDKIIENGNIVFSREASQIPPSEMPKSPYEKRQSGQYMGQNGQYIGQSGQYMGQNSPYTAPNPSNNMLGNQQIPRDIPYTPVSGEYNTVPSSQIPRDIPYTPVSGAYNTIPSSQVNMTDAPYTTSAQQGTEANASYTTSGVQSGIANSTYTGLNASSINAGTSGIADNSFDTDILTHGTSLEPSGTDTDDFLHTSISDSLGSSISSSLGESISDSLDINSDKED